MTDNPGLSVDPAPIGARAPSQRGRSRPSREAPAIGDMVARVLRALIRRAEAGDLEALEQLQRLGREADAALVAAARAAHDGPAAYSWTELAYVLGTTRQAARQRFGR